MRIANIIAAHKNPLQVERLITAMYHPNFDFYIHLDKKIDIEPFLYLEERSQVEFIKNRILCNWGGIQFRRGSDAICRRDSCNRHRI